MAVKPQDWSSTPGSNANVDGTIATGIAEGSDPSSVNDAQRATLAGVALLRDALGGVKVSSGSADAQTLTTGLSLAAYQQGVLIGFEAGAALTNSGAMTFNLDGLGAKSVKTTDGADPPAGAVAAGGIFVLAYEADADVLLLLNPAVAPGSDGFLAAANNLSDLDDAAAAFATIKQAATASATGVVELATAAETTTGTDATRAVTPDGLAGSDYGKAVVPMLIYNGTEDCAVGDYASGIFFRVPSELNGWNLVGVGGHVVTAGVTGTMDVQIHNVTDGVDMLSTKLTIDSGEKDSATAAAAAVINAANDDVATGDEIRVDIDAVHSTPAKGLQVTLVFQKP